MSSVDDQSPLIVPETLAGERVDRAVALLTGWSRSAVREMVERGDVLVDGSVVARSARLEAGTQLEWRGVPTPPPPPGPEPDVAVDVVYSDDDVIVIDKTAGLVVHPGAGHATGTLVGGLLARFDLSGVGDPARPGIVHRLDRDTSGLLVVARTPAAYEALVRDLSAHDVERRYTAVVHGIPSSTRGTVDAPIGRSARWPTRMAVRAGGRDARTHYEVVDVFDDVARLVVELETGRTHQIRVHLAAIDHPVLGDSVYGNTDVRLSRPFLHAARLAFTHPRTGEALVFESPLPPELVTVLEGFGAPRSGPPSG
ncbi:MAG: RluA family pseudouridine synthase [Acidimicrobiia bacterium]|nr:RluA family pseudouridine synthase [Acidimicrobiia bacterium]